ncbi:hypothetical protein ACFY36_38475 [Actinoplanes sp. NPDC000266]
MPAWLNTAGLYAALTFTGLCLVAACAGLFMVARAEIILDLGHRVVAASVIEVSTASRGPGSAEVVFPVDGHQREAWVEQPWWGLGASVGDEISVEYSPAHPSVARRAGAHDALSLVGVAVAATVAGLAFEALRRRFRKRSRRRS